MEYKKNKVVDILKKFKDHVVSLNPGVVLAGLSTSELLKWTEKVTKSGATIYDKAMDVEYFSSHIGGGNHRLFDSSHDLLSAWEKIKEASSTDTFGEEVIGYAQSIWKDMSTTKGLPFFTLNSESYNKWAEYLAGMNIPGLNKKHIYDLCSFDSFEILNTTIGAVGAVFFLNKEDKKKLANLLGSMGVVSVVSANALMGIAMVAITAYAYKKKKIEFSGKDFASGAATTSFSIMLFYLLGLPFLIELIIVAVVSVLIKKTFVSSDQIRALVFSQMQKVINLCSRRKVS